MVTSKGDHSREGLAFEGGAGFGGVRGWGAGEDGEVAVFDLVEGVGVVVGCHRDVAAVYDFGPGVEGVCVEGDVVAAARRRPSVGVDGRGEEGYTY